MCSYMKELCLDKLIVIPANVPPHKQVDDLVSSSDRLQMAKLAVEGLGKNIVVDDIEIKRSGKSYTADTLTQLKEKCPDSEFYLIMGSDMFLTLDHWYRAEEIIKKAIICTACREFDCNGVMEKQKKHLEDIGAKVIFCKDIKILPMSSTEIRTNVKKGQFIQDKVPVKVAEYIKGKHLYI